MEQAVVKQRMYKQQENSHLEWPDHTNLYLKGPMPGLGMSHGGGPWGGGEGWGFFYTQ